MLNEPPDEGNGSDLAWRTWARLLIAELRENQTERRRMREQLDLLRIDVAVLKTKSAAIAAIVAIVVQAVAYFLLPRIFGR